MIVFAENLKKVFLRYAVYKGQIWTGECNGIGPNEFFHLLAFQEGSASV